MFVYAWVRWNVISDIRLRCKVISDNPRTLHCDAPMQPSFRFLSTRGRSSLRYEPGPGPTETMGNAFKVVSETRANTCVVTVVFVRRTMRPTSHVVLAIGSSAEFFVASKLLF